MLYPQTNDRRLSFSLDGVWNFRTAGADSYPDKWTVQPLPEPLPMAMPGSYNEQSDIENLRTHYGWVVYQRTFALPRRLIDGSAWFCASMPPHTPPRSISTASIWVNTSAGSCRLNST